MSDTPFRTVQCAAAAYFSDVPAETAPLTAVDLDTLEIEAFRRQDTTLTSVAHVPGAADMHSRFVNILAEAAGVQRVEAEAMLNAEADAGVFNTRVETAEAFDNRSTVCLSINSHDVTYEAILTALTAALGRDMEDAAGRIRSMAEHGPVLLCGRLSAWSAVTYMFRRLYFRNDPFFDPSLPDDHFVRADKPGQLAVHGLQLLQSGAFRFPIVCPCRIELQLKTLTGRELTPARILLAQPGQSENDLRNAQSTTCFADNMSQLTFLVDGKAQTHELPEGFLLPGGEMISIRVKHQSPLLINVYAGADRTTEIPLRKE